MAPLSVQVAPFGDIAAAVKTWSGPAWLNEARQAALESFAAAGLPTTRMEAWRTTPLPDLGKEPFAVGSGSNAGQARALSEPFLSDEAVTLTFVDGLHSPALSSPRETWPQGVRLTSLSALLATEPESVRPRWTANGASEGAFHALNRAAFRDGASIVVDDGVNIAPELRIVLAATSTDRPMAQHLRNHIHVGRGSSIRVLVTVMGARDAVGFLNNHTSISMAERSKVDLVRSHQSPQGIPHFDALDVAIGPHATLNDTLLQTGLSWTRSEISVILNGERGVADLGGVFVAQGSQVSDVHTVFSHEAPGVVSRQNYRGLAADEARGVFHGQIKVEAQAKGADATQNNRNMLLSKRAQVHSTPALEILTDDVKCKHGSATGQIDPAQLFYLRSRGLDVHEATRILTRAFAGEILSRVRTANTRLLVEGQIAPSLESLGVAA